MLIFVNMELEFKRLIRFISTNYDAIKNYIYKCIGAGIKLFTMICQKNYWLKDTCILEIWISEFLNR